MHTSKGVSCRATHGHILCIGSLVLVALLHSKTQLEKGPLKRPSLLAEEKKRDPDLMQCLTESAPRPVPSIFGLARA